MTQQRTINIELAVEELAEEFVELGSADQARFFHLVADRFAEWSYHEGDTQLHDIGKRLLEASNTTKGLDWVRRLTDFATPSVSDPL